MMPFIGKMLHNSKANGFIYETCCRNKCTALGGSALGALFY